MLCLHAWVTYVQFEYLQPRQLSDRGVSWVHASAADMLRLGHGTYCECAASIMSGGEFWPFDCDASYGAREYHGTEGVYLTELFEAYGGHYAWPCNVFGNNCVYGFCFHVIANPAYLPKAWTDHSLGVSAGFLGVRLEQICFWIPQ